MYSPDIFRDKMMSREASKKKIFSEDDLNWKNEILHFAQNDISVMECYVYFKTLS